MPRNFIRWINALILLLFLTALFHTLSFFVDSVPANDTERQLYTLLQEYQFDFGAGFHRSYHQVVLSLSACFTLLCLFGALANLYFRKKLIDPMIWKGFLTLQVLIYGLLFILMALFAFLPPILCTGLILLTSIGARFSIRT